jgi:pantetheine-phosphate adenylyltransferase
MKKALFTGSFNPLTLGHLNVIERASTLCDTLVVGIAKNSDKSRTLFSPEEIEEMLQETTVHLPNIEIRLYYGLTVEFAKKNNIQVFIRALRSVNDFELELSLACANQKLSGYETLILFSDPKYMHISSTLVKEIALFGGNLNGFVHPYVEKKMKEKIRLNE